MQSGGGIRTRPTAPTLEEVAREANVSRATVSRVVTGSPKGTRAREASVSRAPVSRVVNGSPKVSPDVVTAVNAAIAKLNYVPNRAARSLASRTSGAIALIVPEDTVFFFGDPYFAAIVQGITRRLDDSDYLLNLLVASI